MPPTAPVHLARLGWDDERATCLNTHHPGLEPARVAVEHRGSYILFTESGEVSAEITGRMRHDAVLRTELPAVGDWVAIRPLPNEPKAIIEAVLPRRSSFSRDIAGLTTEEQVLATNIDVLFILAGLDGDLNHRRVERFLALAWESGARPVIVLTKTDRCDDVATAVKGVTDVAMGADVVAVCALDGSGMERLEAHLVGEPTIALLGTTGVGKSTLINRLLGQELMATKKVRWDGKGRHTTSHRQLIPLPEGGAIIDTPGLRELRLWDADIGLDTSFTDIAELASGCRFADCSHEHEPDCAVLAAVEEGILDEARLASYRKLVRELAALERKKDIHLARELARKFKKVTSEARTRSRERW